MSQVSILWLRGFVREDLISHKATKPQRVSR
jgi:hypothetical protein